jgi:ligand-binding sensor domain-containing protein
MIVALAGVAIRVHLRRHAVLPVDAARFTSTRYVNCIAIGPDRSVWVGTNGGLLRRDPGGGWRKFTRQDGLPSDEIRQIRFRHGAAVTLTPGGAAIESRERWRPLPDLPPDSPSMSADRTCSTYWQGALCEATAEGLRIRQAGGWRQIPLPGSRGSHVSALVGRRNVLWAALYGDGLWAWDGSAWQRLEAFLPAGAREVTAMAASGQHIWIGTRRDGVWEGYGNRWTHYLAPDEPIDSDVQAIAYYHGAVWVSTLQDGLAVRTARGWGHVAPPNLSSVAPRQLVVYRGRLYVRSGDGTVDAYDGHRWTRNIFPDLPRRQASALAADADRLYAAQWGGWSEWDGSGWTHHLNLPDLQGIPVTVLFPDGADLWIGTQGRGLACWHRQKDRLTWYDERSGLPDDWVTAIARSGGALYAGTYTGGLAKLEGETWRSDPGLSGRCVTALAPHPSGGLFVATRTGSFRLNASGRLTPLESRFPALDPEGQALCALKAGIWIGTRTGLCWIPEG